MHLFAEVPPRGDGPGASAEGPARRWFLVDGDDDARMIGRRVRQIRNVRRKSLAVVAGLAGISTGHLSRIERGERALDRGR